MPFYHNQVTKKSWQELQKLNKELDFILIGGWAVYLYAQQLKSKDIDIIVGFDQLSLLKKEYSLVKNERLKKYEAVSGEVEIDVYLPHYSDLGIPVEKLISQARSLEGFKVLKISYLFVLKVYTLAQRGRSLKGRKDFIDLVFLWQLRECNTGRITEIIKKHRLEKELGIFVDFVNENVELPELNLSRHQYAKFKKEVLFDLS